MIFLRWAIIAILLCVGSITVALIKANSQRPAYDPVPYCLVQGLGIFWPCDEVWREYDI